MHIQSIRTAAFALAGAALLPTIAFAQVSATVDAGAQVGAGTSGATVQTTAQAEVRASLGTTGERAKERANQEIDRRIESLNALEARIDGMARLSAEFKQVLSGNVDTQIQAMQALKTKIAAQTDLEALKADVRSIGETYRIYRLVIPQGHISAMADKLVNITVMMQTAGAKLQARVQAAAGAGADVTAATKALTDMANNLTTAQVKAKAAMDLILPLKPDEGDKATQDANNAALKKARTELQAGHQAVVAARKNMKAVVEFLASVTVNASATSTTSTSTQ